MSHISSAFKALTKHMIALENAIKADEKSLSKKIDQRIKVDMVIEAGKIEIDRAKTVIQNHKALYDISAKVEAAEAAEQAVTE